MRCKECGKKKATAIINKKDVCDDCFEILKRRKRRWGKTEIKKSWLDKLAERKNEN